jgi:hypothetical protein
MGRISPSSEALSVELAGPAAVRIGELLCAALRVVNRTRTPQRVSARLNLTEGDVRLVVTRPDGSVKRAHASRLVDSAARFVELPPGAALESGLALLHAHTGFLFDEPGGFQVVAQYDGVPRTPPLTSPALHVNAGTATADKEADLARRMLDPSVGLSFELGEPASAAAERLLESIAEDFSGQLEGRAARLLVSIAHADRRTIARVIDDFLAADSPVDAARELTALISPATPNGSIVRETLRDRLGRSDSTLKEVALSIAETRPYYPDQHDIRDRSSNDAG